MDFGLFLEFPRPEGGSEQDAFRDSFALVAEAERLGVDSVWLAEYHFVPGRVLAAPVTISGAIAARTERIRIGLAVLLLPLGNPVRIAEEIATLDHLSQGRVEFGVGRGTFPNVHEGFNVPFTESRGRFDESLEIILKAWTSERFSFQGDYYHYDGLEVTPKPFQTPHPPIHVGITSAESFPLIGRMGHHILINPSRVFSLDELKPQIQAYRQAWTEAGHAGEGKVGVRIPIYVSESADKAYKEPRESALFSKERLEIRTAEYANYSDGTKGWQEQSERIGQMNYDDWLKDQVAYGTPGAVVERLGNLRDDLGLNQIMFELNFGNLIPLERQLKSLKLFSEQVIPQLR